MLPLLLRGLGRPTVVLFLGVDLVVLPSRLRSYRLAPWFDPGCLLI